MKNGGRVTESTIMIDYQISSKDEDILKFEILSKIKQLNISNSDSLLSSFGIDVENINKEISPVACDLGRDIFDLTVKLIKNQYLQGNYFSGAEQCYVSRYRSEIIQSPPISLTS